MPVSPTAIDHPQPVSVLLAPARPLPAAPERPRSNRPQLGGGEAPRAEALAHAAAVEIRGVIGSAASVGGNAAHIGAPGIAGLAQKQAAQVETAAVEAIGRNVDARA